MLHHIQNDVIIMYLYMYLTAIHGGCFRFLVPLTTERQPTGACFDVLKAYCVPSIPTPMKIRASGGRTSVWAVICTPLRDSQRNIGLGIDFCSKFAKNCSYP